MNKWLSPSSSQLSEKKKSFRAQETVPTLHQDRVHRHVFALSKVAELMQVFQRKWQQTFWEIIWNPIGCKLENGGFHAPQSICSEFPTKKAMWFQSLPQNLTCPLNNWRTTFLLKLFRKHLSFRGVYLNHTKCWLEPRKNPLTFHYNGWLIGILTMVYYNPYITG